ncbi:MAG: SDR family oxidoreductase [Actinomycetaceae bacterium]|nr:SDR family oxidoreductase [Actinomycetaceae bacterium]
MGKALITGASAGLGREFARTLAAEGNDVVLVARNEARLAELAEQLKHEFGVDAQVLAADLSVEADIARVASRLSDDADPVTLLVNNAGFGVGQDFIGGRVEREIEALNVMVRAVLELSHAAANAMVARGRGGILNIASMTSLTAQGTYSAHKAWVSTFTEGLAAELSGSGVHVTVSNPGLIRTEFHERSEVDASQWPDVVFAQPEQIVKESLNALRAGKVIVTPTPLYKAAAAALRIMPRRLVRKVAGPGLSGRDG